MKHRVVWALIQANKQILHHRLSHSVTDFITKVCHFSQFN